MQSIKPVEISLILSIMCAWIMCLQQIIMAAIWLFGICRDGNNMYVNAQPQYT